MSETSIYVSLRSAGLTRAGACALMGNMYCESLLESNNVQDGMGYSDENYVRDVDNGRISRESFATDQRGFGLCQWTYHERKRNLYNFAVKKGVSIADEDMQVQFCIQEFPKEAPDTWNLCCTSDDMYKCTEWICKYYERPYINNVEDRFKRAQMYYAAYGEDYAPVVTVNDVAVPALQPTLPSVQSTDSSEIYVRTLREGDKGRDVYLAQCGINDCGFNCGEPDGDFGDNTRNGVIEFQKACNLNPTGEVNHDVWQIIFQ